MTATAVYVAPTVPIEFARRLAEPGVEGAGSEVGEAELGDWAAMATSMR
jgi:hypothetical protein